MARTGIGRIDQLFEGQAADAIGPDDPDREAVGAAQDLLIAHGFKLPDLRGADHGRFGSKTTDSVTQFQQKNNLDVSGVVDSPTLQGLVVVPAVSPTASRPYLALVLDFAFTGMMRVMSFTTLFEGAGLFAALNRNTDRAGLSFGLIQWAQKPDRLNELLRAFQAGQPATFAQILGGGDEAVAQGLIGHTARPKGGVDEQGRTTDPDFDLIAEPWLSRFQEVAHNRDLQRVQVETALGAFQASLRKLRAFAPQIASERGVAFMLDLANQHGDGGAQNILRAVQNSADSETDLLARVEAESVARVRAQFGEGSNEARSTQNRREAFRTTPLLSDEAFNAE